MSVDSMLRRKYAVARRSHFGPEAAKEFSSRVALSRRNFAGVAVCETRRLQKRERVKIAFSRAGGLKLRRCMLLVHAHSRGIVVAREIAEWRPNSRVELTSRRYVGPAAKPPRAVREARRHAACNL